MVQWTGWHGGQGRPTGRWHGMCVWLAHGAVLAWPPCRCHGEAQPKMGVGRSGGAEELVRILTASRLSAVLGMRSSSTFLGYHDGSIGVGLRVGRGLRRLALLPGVAAVVRPKRELALGRV